jgi:hypothetical protein
MADQGVTPFARFLDNVKAAKHADFAAAPASLVKQPDKFEEMRTHILKLYEGTQVPHSFVDANGSTFDCVPIEQQPSLRGVSGAIPKAPDLPTTPKPPTPAGEAHDWKPTEFGPQLGPDRKDQFGNVMNCPNGTIPIRRVTLEDMSRFENLRSFLQKRPGGGAIPPKAASAPPQAAAATHRWAHAFQNVANLGGHSFINVWDPPIGANQVFSLSQHWYVGGSGAGLQTAEVGWQVYPQFYGNTKPVFFIYWTADGYNQTGCYNLSCTGFVQTNSSWAIGGAMSPWSVTGGAQYELEIAYFLTGGRWWLYVKGTAGANAIGYYPVSVYKNGAMASHAAEIDYGGETVGTTSFPKMGSGAFANQGWQKACYQRQIYYYPQAGGSAWAALTASQAWPNCYTAQVVNYAAPWNETLWYGGPGGNC